MSPSRLQALRWAALPLVALWPWPAPAADAASPIIEVAVEDGLLTVELHDAPLGDVLRRVGERAGFRVMLRGELDRPVSWSFAGVPVEAGLRRLLGDASWALIHDRPRHGAEDSGVTELHVLDGGGETQESTASLRPVDPRATRGRAATTDRVERLREVQRLADRADASDTERLTTLLSEDENPAIRRVAVVGLARIAGNRAREALAAVLFDRDAAARSSAVPATSGGDQARVVEPLSAALARDPDAEVRRLAARTLATLARLAVEDALQALDRARVDPDPGVREVVAAAVRERR